MLVSAIHVHVSITSGQLFIFSLCLHCQLFRLLASTWFLVSERNLTGSTRGSETIHLATDFGQPIDEAPQDELSCWYNQSQWVIRFCIRKHGCCPSAGLQEHNWQELFSKARFSPQTSWLINFINKIPRLMPRLTLTFLTLFTDMHVIYNIHLM